MKQLSINAHTVLLALLVIALPYASAAWAQTEKQPSTPSTQKTFATPQLAAEALIKASEDYDLPALMEIFGPEGKYIVGSADPVRDKEMARQFVEKAHEKNTVSVSGGKATLLIGKDAFPMPVPIVRKQGKWYFDARAGREEILFRRIGANELDAIRICRGFVEAQKEYASTIHDDSGIHQYAQKIISTPGKQDGLYWQNPDGTSGGPVGETVARAIEEGYSLKGPSQPPSPFHGYYFKVLKGQGPAAPLGELDYVVKGLMIGGFAMVAVPAEYRVTGVKTFIVSHDGIVYEKDLGPDSLKIAKEMERYNPDKSWQRTKDAVIAEARLD